MKDKKSDKTKTSNIQAAQSSAVQSYDPNQVRPQDAITLTEGARQHVEKKLKARGQGAGLRLGIKKSGCTGYAYVVDFVDEPNEDDLKFPDATNAELIVYVSRQHFPIVRGTRLDYVKQGLNHLFTFENPNETASCGCGESFSVDED